MDFYAGFDWAIHQRRLPPLERESRPVEKLFRPQTALRGTALALGPGTPPLGQMAIYAENSGGHPI